MNIPAARPVSMVAGSVVTFAPQIGAYTVVGGMLLLLFRTVFRALSVKDTEMVRLVGQLRRERDRAQRWERWQSARADHWYAVALGDTHPPPIPPEPVDVNGGADPDVIQPPN